MKVLKIVDYYKWPTKTRNDVYFKSKSHGSNVYNKTKHVTSTINKKK